MTTLYRMSLLVFLATCLGIGVFRFSYTALMPIIIVQYGWTHDFASFLGSANLLGYLLGALLALFSIKEKSIPILIVSSAVVGSLSLLCCAFIHMPLVWFVFWRTISGIAGSLLMILAPSFAMKNIAMSQRLKVNFLGFSGIGVGVLYATIIIPLLKNMPVQYVWGIFRRSLFLAVCYFSNYSNINHSSLFKQLAKSLKASNIHAWEWSLLLPICAVLCLYSALFVLDGLLIGNLAFSIATAKFVLGAVWHRKLYRRFCGLLFKPLHRIFTSN